MPNLPAAKTQLNEQASAFAGGTGYLAVLACVAENADLTPRVFTSTQALLSEHTYSQGVDYCALHFDGTDQPVIFVGMPIETAGTIGQLNNSGVTGTSQITISVGSSGSMDQVDGELTITAGTTVGTDQIAFNYSLDGGITNVPVRLGTASSYTIPNIGQTINFGAGTVNIGDTLSWASTAPTWSTASITAARVALSRQQLLVRSWNVIGDAPNLTHAQQVYTEANNYETENERFVYARASLPDLNPLATKSQVLVRMTGAPSLTFAASGHTATRASGSFVTDGFAIGQMVTIAGSTSNNGTIGPLTGVSATVLTFGSGVVNEGPVSGVSVSASEGLTFDSVGHTITRAGGGSGESWLLDGFAVGMSVAVTGTADNNTTLGPITTLTGTVMTFAAGVSAEGPIASVGVNIVQSETLAAFTAATSATFASIDAQKRIDLSYGRARVASPLLNDAIMRRPASWAVSIREYEHDVQIPTYRKTDGPLNGFSLLDATGNTAEFDEQLDGGGLAGRFTCLRSCSNGPLGAFVALSLTRDSEGALLSRTHNMAVADLAQSVIQAETENAIGQVLALNSDGTGTQASLSLIEQRVNTALQNNLLQRFAEGPRASSAVWTASRTDVLNVPGATLNGSCDLELEGTIENINTQVRVR